MDIIFVEPEETDQTVQMRRLPKSFARIRLNLLLNFGVKLISFATNALFPVIGFRWIPVKLAPAYISTHLLMIALATES